ncbi:MAG: DEAD/DEAH box helicase [Halobacteriales archaeon]|nr:DEAD/DEAH box helicase [Halobacteriales archaeon]
MQVADVVPDFADAFPFTEFNRMQREALPVILETDDNVVASAPTASGKTALAELAIVKTLQAGGTALFIAPLRALTNEKEREWARFEELGYSVYVVTGERDLNPRRAERADVLVMTPEKADSATRKHDSARYGFITGVDCCVIDEVHLLDSERRGSVLEVTIARLRRLCDPRIIALSATMPNIEDVAAWLDAPESATFAFGDEYRPVELHAGVETYSHGENAFADKYRRLYRALDLADPHLREDGQALVFVASRQDTVRAAEKARDELAGRDVPVGARGDFEFHEATQQLGNETLRQSVLDGVAFHHAGLAKRDKDLVEEWFREGHIVLLFSTSTLAWGVNLPARCVVIRDTKYHDPLEGEVDMSPVDVLQMLGRAGRPDYDDVGYGWVVCDAQEADYYRRLLAEGTPLESRLAEELDSHLVAEVAMGTVASLDDVLDWLETTFYYVRARSQPEAYDFPTLRDRVRASIDELADRGFLERDDGALRATTLGRLASAFYLRLETAAGFHEVATAGSPDEESVLRCVARAAEFDSVSARQAEREAVRAVLGPDDGELAPGTRKVLAILRGSLGGGVPDELTGDAWVIRQNALRLLSALRAFCDRFGRPRAANLARRVEARLEHGVADDAVGLTAIDGVGSGRAQKLAAEGLTTPAAVREAGVEGLVAAGLTEGVAERVLENAAGLPAVEVDWGGFPEAVSRGDSSLHEVTVATTAGGARSHCRVTVNGVEMTAKEAYLNAPVTLPVGVFGAEDALEFAVEVCFPELPLAPVVESRRVAVE